MISFTKPETVYKTNEEKLAADIFSEEINKRRTSSANTDYTVEFLQDDTFLSPDDFSISADEQKCVFSALGIRGLIFAVGMFLRKTELDGEKFYLCDEITGTYSPNKKIRGHQLGYRQKSNTYDAWSIDNYKRYYLDIMYFGANTCEHIPYENGYSDRNAIMKYDEQELLCEAAQEAEKLGLDVSLWYPNCEKSHEEAAKNREKLFSECKKIDYVFPPGGDPGDLLPEVFVERCKISSDILKKYHPNAQMWPSVQQPHKYPDWGVRFISEMKKLPEFIDGVITGPNAAFPIDILRKHLPEKYPIRFYPDITHNLRCEYPVHFDKDDWHYALQVVNGRECANPRPSEYKRIYKNVMPYAVGSVSYSEGINDDINKAVWCALDFNPDLSVKEILEDYARLFFAGSSPEEVADAIFGLEKNWEGAPDENPCIEHTLTEWENIGKKNSSLTDNWRYIQCLFRAECDAFVRRKIIFENKLIKKAYRYIVNGDLKNAKSVLCSSYPKEITDLRQDIENNAEKLYRLIGLQLGTKKYHALNFERGAVLDTIDLPVTNLPWLMGKFEETEKDGFSRSKTDFIKRCFERDKVGKYEYLYSVALDGLSPGSVTQDGGFYMNVQGDRPDKNNGTMPISLFKVYDHFSFRLKTGGLKPDTDYILQITYRDTGNDGKLKHSVKINGNTVYSGDRLGETRNIDFEKDMLPDGFIAIEYRVKADYIINGCVVLEITEPTNGFELAELRFTEEPYKS